ncbi:molybdopterin-guanine dinucleotide biosynthesis protein B [Persephonella sp.]
MNRPVICIVGAHNSGKTTFITSVISLLKAEGYKVTAVKHDPKGKAVTDTEGKDSYKMFEAGADQVILASPGKITSYIKTEENYTPMFIIENLIFDDPDLIILEGFKWFEGIDKYEVIRKIENRELLLKDSSDLKGVITDYYKFNPSFDINNPKQFVQFIKETYLKIV